MYKIYIKSKDYVMLHGQFVPGTVKGTIYKRVGGRARRTRIVGGHHWREMLHQTTHTYTQM